MIPLKFVPSLKVASIVSSMLIIFPLAAFVNISQSVIPPTGTSISLQAWLLSVVGAAMGITKIVLWFRGEKDDSSGSSQTNKLLEIQTQQLAKLAETDQKLLDIQDKIADAQQRIADAQFQALQNHVRIIEGIGMLKLMIENHEDKSAALVEQAASKAVSDLKDFMRRE